MTTQPHLTKGHLLAEINAAWAALNETLDAMTADQLTGPTDAAGWTVKDHMAHMAAWDDWAIALLDGVPGWEGLGVSETIYFEGDEDTTNEAIRQRYAGKSAAAVRADLLTAHERVMDRLEALSEAQVAAPYRDRRDDDPPERTIPPVANVIYGATAEHYVEHLGWLRAIAG